ncbi:MAG: diphthamide synthesis protein [Nanoarchaeota archaeon]
MKIMFVEARLNKEIPLERLGEIKEQKIGLLATIQHIGQLDRIKENLEQKGKEVYTARGKLTQYEGQILGCDSSAAMNIAGKVDAFLYVGTGDFHPLHVALKLKKTLYLLSPEGEIEKISEEKLERIYGRKKAALAKFYTEDKVGIIVSTKPGQENLRQALVLKKMLEKKGKEAFIFACDLLKLDELENFDCKAWINTACIGLQLEENFLTTADLVDYFRG